VSKKRAFVFPKAGKQVQSTGLCGDGYRPIDASTAVRWGESVVKALASWTDGCDTINAVKDDGCLVFVLESNGQLLQWIPKEILSGAAKVAV
jgi:hypothetical protein